MNFLFSSREKKRAVSKLFTLTLYFVFDEKKGYTNTH